MPNILYAQRIIDRTVRGITFNDLKNTFQEAITINKKLIQDKKKIAYFFIDPLFNYFEAGNSFYFNVFECRIINKLNCYRTGAGPIQAFMDALQLLKSKLYDAVFIFGHEPLLADKKRLGNEFLAQAMDIFPGTGLPKCYNSLAEEMCCQLGLNDRQFEDLADKLYDNYLRTYVRLCNFRPDNFRGRSMEQLGAPLFKLTDCANPNINFAGGVIVANPEIGDLLGIPARQQIKVLAADYAVVQAEPALPRTITGTADKLFPHLQQVFSNIEKQSKVKIIREFRDNKLLLDVYTCYPPIPLGFLLACGFAGTLRDLPALLDEYAVTITGGMSLAGAPWNNPALRSSIAMCEQLLVAPHKYGLVHGNGGMGESQGLILLEK